MREGDFAARLLRWYDAHARVLPWRSPPGCPPPDPYRVWLSEIMLQQTTVPAVIPYFDRFTALWPDVASLAATEDGVLMSAWAGLGYYARARNLLACARVVVADHGGAFPDTEDGLRALPGIGPYTAAAIAAIAFDRPANVVDGNVERVIVRHADIRQPMPGAKPQIRTAAAGHVPATRPGDYAQALMDLGATVCTPKSPSCGACPVATDCRGRIAGTAADLPARTARKPRPLRRGWAHVALCDAGWILQRRPAKGLLGGMLGWPGGAWAETADPEPPFDADWIEAGGEVRHVFTHFELRLGVRVARLGREPEHQRGAVMIPRNAFDPADLPSVMKKAFLLVRENSLFEPDGAARILPRETP